MLTIWTLGHDMDTSIELSTPFALKITVHLTTQEYRKRNGGKGEDIQSVTETSHLYETGQQV